MDLTLTIPAHVAAAFTDADAATAFALSALTAEAQAQALAAASDAAQQLLREAAAPFAADAPAPEVPTLAQRVSTTDQRLDRVPGLAVVAVEAALVAADAMANGTPLAEAKATAVESVVAAISGTSPQEPGLGEA